MLKPFWLTWGNAGVTVQELLGHANVVTAMIYTHVLNRPGISVNPVRKDGALTPPSIRN
jgi:integrase